MQGMGKQDKSTIQNLHQEKKKYPQTNFSTDQSLQKPMTRKKWGREETIMMKYVGVIVAK